MEHIEYEGPPGVRDVSATDDLLDGQIVQITREDEDGKLMIESLHPIDATEQLGKERDDEATDLFNSLSPEEQADVASSEYP